MSVPVCPDDFILVSLDRKFRDVSEGGLYIDTQFRPGHHATVTGTVLSVPKGLSNHVQKRVIPMEVQVGDELAFAYRVVYNQVASDNAADIFYEDPADSAYVTTWTAQNGLHLIRKYKGKNQFEAAIYRIEKNKSVILDKTKGDSKHVNAFIKAYNPDRDTSISYKNCFHLNEREYWKVDYQMAYVAKRPNGEMVMIGGYALLEAPVGGIDRYEYTGNLELWGKRDIKIKKELRAKVIAIGTPLKDQPKISIVPGETAVVYTQTAQEYNFWGTDYILVRQDQILGKVA